MAHLTEQPYAAAVAADGEVTEIADAQAVALLASVGEARGHVTQGARAFADALARLDDAVEADRFARPSAGSLDRALAAARAGTALARGRPAPVRRPTLRVPTWGVALVGGMAALICLSAWVVYRPPGDLAGSTSGEMATALPAVAIDWDALDDATFASSAGGDPNVLPAVLGGSADDELSDALDDLTFLREALQ